MSANFQAHKGFFLEQPWRCLNSLLLNTACHLIWDDCVIAVGGIGEASLSARGFWCRVVEGGDEPPEWAWKPVCVDMSLNKQVCGFLLALYGGTRTGEENCGFFRFRKQTALDNGMARLTVSGFHKHHLYTVRVALEVTVEPEPFLLIPNRLINSLPTKLHTTFRVLFSIAKTGLWILWFEKNHVYKKSKWWMLKNNDKLVFQLSPIESSFIKVVLEMYEGTIGKEGNLSVYLKNNSVHFMVNGVFVEIFWRVDEQVGKQVKQTMSLLIHFLNFRKKILCLSFPWKILPKKL